MPRTHSNATAPGATPRTIIITAADLTALNGEKVDSRDIGCFARLDDGSVFQLASIVPGTPPAVDTGNWVPALAGSTPPAAQTVSPAVIDDNGLALVNASGGAISVPLPAAGARYDGQVVQIVDVGDGTNDATATVVAPTTITGPAVTGAGTNFPVLTLKYFATLDTWVGAHGW